MYCLEDVKPTQKGARLLAEKTVATLNRRLNWGAKQRAKISQLEDNRIEVGIYGNEPTAVKEVMEAIEYKGTLEFRIVANKDKHKDEIEIAKKDMHKDIYVDSKGNWTARWIPLQKNQKNNFSWIEILLARIQLMIKILLNY